jgi:hypothetical protein
MYCKAIYPRHFDTDEDGKVSVDELTRILLQLGDSAIPEEDLPLFLQATCLITLTYYLHCTSTVMTESLDHFISQPSTSNETKKKQM